MKKQTAVDYIFYTLCAENTYRWVYEKAKAMEKEQIVDAYLQGESDADHYDDSAFRYYNETYGGDK